MKKVQKIFNGQKIAFSKMILELLDIQNNNNKNELQPKLHTLLNLKYKTMKWLEKNRRKFLRTRARQSVV